MVSFQSAPTLQQKIQQTWRRIEQTVPNMKFNYDFWMINTPVRSTYPACRAVLAARQQGADFEDKMIGAIQTAYYQKAKNPGFPLKPGHLTISEGYELRDLGSFEQVEALPFVQATRKTTPGIRF